MTDPTSTILTPDATTIYRSAEMVFSLMVSATPCLGTSRPRKRDHWSLPWAMRITPGVSNATFTMMVSSTWRATRMTPEDSVTISFHSLIRAYVIILYQYCPTAKIGFFQSTCQVYYHNRSDIPNVQCVGTRFIASVLIIASLLMDAINRVPTHHPNGTKGYIRLYLILSIHFTDGTNSFCNVGGVADIDGGRALCNTFYHAG